MDSKRHSRDATTVRSTVDLADLGADRLALGGAFSPAEIRFPNDVRLMTPLVWSGFLDRAGVEIRLAGRLETRLELVCVRCLEPISEPVQKEFDLFFRQRDAWVYEENAEIELSEPETRVGFITGTELRLDQIMREQVLLALPMKPLCSPDCLGLCPSCGANLNTASCTCSESRAHPAFDALLEFKKRLEGPRS